MQDWYQIPALVLTALLLPAFGSLYLRSRDTRTLLWFLAFVFSVIRMVLLYPLRTWDFSHGSHSWHAAIGQSCALLSSALILGSLSPVRFRLGKVRILYVIPFIGPMLVYAVVSFGVLHNQSPSGQVFMLFPALCVAAITSGLFWAKAEQGVRGWVGACAVIIFGGLALWACFNLDFQGPLVFAETGNHAVAALLILFVFRRVSSGTAISVLGLLGWACPALLMIPVVGSSPDLYLNLTRVIVMANVVTSLGLILVALENEIALNRANSERERRARKEMEAYTGFAMSRRKLQDFDAQGTEICRMVVENSRFAHAALVLLQPSGALWLAGAAGFDSATGKALGALAPRIPVDGFAPGSAPPAVPGSLTMEIDLGPWLTPGDDLSRLGFTFALVVPMQGRESAEGGLILGGMRQGTGLGPLRKDDLLPLEMLAVRLQAVRSQTMMLEKLIDTEKFAGLGQLAGNITQKLNNPLTVILGYASLLEDAPHLDEHQRKGIEAILSEARQMRTTLHGLSQIARSPAGPRTAISLHELLTELEILHRSEFLQRSIRFQLNVSPAIPRVLCHAQQLRQAFLHCLQFAMDAVELQVPGTERTVRVDASAEGDRVQIAVAHSGPAFHHPDRAFGPFGPPGTDLDVSGLGLSICATILRDNEGRASAVNLGNKGAAILLDLRAGAGIPG